MGMFTRLKSWLSGDCPSCVSCATYSEDDVRRIIMYWQQKVKEARLQGQKEAVQTKRKSHGTHKSLKGCWKEAIKLIEAKRVSRKKFIKACCVYEKSVFTTAKDIYSIYKWWCEKNKHVAGDVSGFGRAINKTRTYKTTRNYQGKYDVFGYVGIRVKSSVQKEYEEALSAIPVV